MKRLRGGTALVLGMVLVAGLVGGYQGTAARAATASSWNADPLVWPQLPQADLHGIDCAGNSLCFAVGSSVAASGAMRPFIERSQVNGSWTRVHAPMPTGAQDAVLLDVSCAAAEFCVAVGHQFRDGVQTALAERWDGSHWTVQQPVSRGATDLVAVSCVARHCEAVGSARTATGRHALVETTTDGISWTVVPAPRPRFDYSTYLGVSCVSGGFCAAVGTAGNQDTDEVGSYDAVMLTTDASGAHLTDLSGGSIATLHGVSCTSSTFCTAVGWATAFPEVDRPLVRAWNGTGWRTSPADTGVDPAQPTDVRCVSETACIVVGYGGRSDGPAAWSWTGSQLVDSPPPHSPDLTGVTCPSVCIAAGGAAGGSIEYYDGSRWTNHAGMSPDGPVESALTAESCVSESWCMAVGTYSLLTGGTRGLAERWDGAAWTPVPISAGGGAVTLTSVSCTSPTFCVAGGYTDAVDSVVETWDGGSWTRADVPNAGAVLTTSCVSPTACVLTATFQASLIWDGVSWRKVQLAAPDSTPDLAGIDCVSAHDCTAVGLRWASRYGGALIEHWNGRRWQVVPAPKGPQGHINRLTGVSCVSARSCVAVGSTETLADGLDGGLVLRWNGTSWRAIAHPHHPLAAVSCVSAGECVAVGPNRFVLTITGDSTTRSSAADVPAAMSGPDLNGVDCVAGVCRSVGTYDRAGRHYAVAESASIG